MAVSLKLSYLQSNDAKTIRFTDTTGEYSDSNLTGWGAPNEVVSDVVAAGTTTALKYHLFLTISVTDSSSVKTEYDPIDLYSDFTLEFSKTSSMIYEITGDNLKEDGEAVLTSDDELPDGLWEVTYKITDADDDTVVNEITYTSFIIGHVEKKVANAILTAVYGAERGINQENWGNLKRALIKAVYLKGMQSYNSISRVNRKLNILNTLENYTANDE